MRENRFARRGPSVGIVVGGIVLTLAVSGAATVGWLLLNPPPTGPGEELYSEETGVKQSVFLPFATWNPTSESLEVAAFITALVEATGTCTLIATDGDTRLSTRAVALPDSSTMTCGVMTLSDTRLSEGSWTVTVNYRSPGIDVSSAPTVVEIQS